MSKVLVTEGHLNNIAEAIRAKNGAATTYRPGDMAAAIQAIPTGGDVDVEALSVIANGTYTAPTGKAYSPVTVNVPGGDSALILPEYQGGAYSYLALNGNYYQNNAGKIYYSSYYHVYQGHLYAIFIGETISDRLRVHFYAGKQYTDFETYVNNAMPSQVVYTCTENISGNSELEGDRLKERLLYKPAQDGEIIVITSRSSVAAVPYCIQLS